jgi:PAS domain S-box-containing protein
MPTAKCLLLAPTGRDASVARILLEKAGVEAVECADLGQLQAGLSDDVDLVVVADEALRGSGLEPIAAWVQAQPKWSDLPFVVMTRKSHGPARESELATISNALRNATLLERPFRPSTFDSVIAAARKARERQREARAHIRTLREAELQLRSALRAGHLGAWRLDVESATLVASEECKEAFGRAADAPFTLQDLLSQVHPDDAKTVRAVLRAREDETDEIAQFRNRWPDGTRHWTELRARTARDLSGKAWLTGVVSDITERKAFLLTLEGINEELEQKVAERTAALEKAHSVVLQEIEQRQRTESRLRQAQKMEMIGQLTGGVAHDFNNLLMAILGNLDLLRTRVTGDTKARRWIDNAMEGAQRGAALTRRLLAFARRQELVVERRDVAALVKGMRDLMQSSIPPGIDLHIEAPEGLPTARLDSVQVELAVLNLVVNARDAMPGGGRLCVIVDTARQEAGNGATPANYVRISVTDTGSGMDEETLAKATEPFFTTKEVGKGTGLGLSMVHGLAQQLGGDLRLHSRPGEGTRAELWLPACNENAEPLAEWGHAYTPAGPARARILLVDDDRLVASSTTALLEELGYKVTVADTPAAALEIIRSDQPIDLVLTDFLMPKMNGSELAKAARLERPDLPILLVTGYAELSEAHEIDLPRLSKPFRLHDLQTQLRRLLN